MHTRIHLSFSEPGKLFQDFLKAISAGKLSLELSKNYQPGEKLDLEVMVPSQKNPFRIQAQVKSRNMYKGSVDAVIINRAEVEKLLGHLYQLPPYNEFMEKRGSKPTLELEEIEEISYDSEIEKPVANIKRQKLSAHNSLPLSSDFIKPVTNSVSRVNLPPIKGKAPIAKVQVNREKRSSRAEANCQEKGSPNRIIEERVRQYPPDVFNMDPLQKIKHWLEIENEPTTEDTSANISTAVFEQETLSVKNEPTNIADIKLFLQSLINGLNRDLYYSPEHPEYKMALYKLYREFKKALSTLSEIGIILIQPPDSAPNFFITGITPLPISIEELLGEGALQCFLQNYLNYFQTRHLVCLFLKSSLSQEQFYSFLKIMSQPLDKIPDSYTSIGHILNKKLIERQLKDVLAIFEEDLIYLPPGLGWQVEMMINRFAKELKNLSLFQNDHPEQIPELKNKIAQNLLMSLQTPEIIKDLILNVDALIKQVPGLAQEQPSDSLIQNLPSHLLIPVGNYLLQEMFKLNEQSGEPEKVDEIIISRLEQVWTFVLKISHRLIKDTPPGAGAFLESVCNNHILSLSDLPASVRKEINRKEMTNEFQQNPAFWMERFAIEKSTQKLKLLLQYFSAMVPCLVQRNDWQNLYLLTEAVANLPLLKRKMLAETGITDPQKTLWEKGIKNLINSLWEPNPELQKGIAEIFILLGEFGIQSLYQALLQEENSTRKKILIESLLKFGPESMEKLRDILRDPKKPAGLQSLAIEAIGRSRNASDAEIIKPFLNHPKHELRIQALTALSRILGPDSLSIIEPLIADPNPMVRKRIVLMLGLFAGIDSYARNRLKEIAFDPEAEEDLRVTALQELAKNPPEDENERLEIQEKTLEMIMKQETFSQRLKSEPAKSAYEPEMITLTALDMIGKIGDQNALQKLSQINYSYQTLSLKKEQALDQMRLRME